ncbi:MAG: hypothetical protein KJN87_08915 [Desulfofustis sp.]|nr:hypothetical protein [Desulfofustis sp.]
MLELEPEDVLNKIGTFPEGEKHCATLAMKALQEAVNNYMISVVRKYETQAGGQSVFGWKLTSS